MRLVLGPIAPLSTRALYTEINTYLSWNAWVSLIEDAKEKIWFGQNNVIESIWFKSGATQTVFSDASHSGYGGYCVEMGQFMCGLWSELEIQLSSTLRELKAVIRCRVPWRPY